MTAAHRTRLARREILSNAWLLALAVRTYGFSAPAVLAVEDLAAQIVCAGVAGVVS